MYAIVDIETTGGHASAHGITEIAICVHDGEKIIDQYHSLVNPGQSIPIYIKALTGISDEMLVDAPYFEEIAEEVYTILKDCIFVAHNVNFDYSFIRHNLKVAGYELNVKKLCTIRLGRKVFPGLPSYSLGNFCKSLGITINGRHRAGGDANATAVLFDRMLQQDGKYHIEAMLKKSSAEQWLPLHVDKSIIEKLPNAPGVYYFHDLKGKIIYVGKAINLKKRVSGHFTQNDAHRKRQNFLRHVHNITHIVCANELQALIFESIEIKRLWPKYNFSQKQPEQKFGLYCYEDNSGYMRLAIEKRKKHFPAQYHFNLLHEGQIMLQKMVDEFELHPKLCYVDKNRLTNKERAELDPPPIYNGKVKRAIETLNEQLPTFALVDRGLSEGEKLYLLIEKGSFWGMGFLNEKISVNTLEHLKRSISPYPDNDFIRNSIYAHAASHPEKKLVFG